MCFADVERSAGDATAPERNITAAQYQQQRTRYGKQRSGHVDLDLHTTVMSSRFNTDHRLKTEHFQVVWRSMCVAWNKLVNLWPVTPTELCVDYN